MQTESFIFEGGVLRVRWETKNESRPGGTFTLTIHSAISGRELAVLAEQRGMGTGEAFLQDEPRPAYAIVTSEHVDWSFTVEEGQLGTVETPAPPASPGG